MWQSPRPILRSKPVSSLITVFSELRNVTAKCMSFKSRGLVVLFNYITSANQKRHHVFQAPGCAFPVNDWRDLRAFFFSSGWDESRSSRTPLFLFIHRESVSQATYFGRGSYHREYGVHWQAGPCRARPPLSLQTPSHCEPDGRVSALSVLSRDLSVRHKWDSELDRKRGLMSSPARSPFKNALTMAMMISGCKESSNWRCSHTILTYTL